MSGSLFKIYGYFLRVQKNSFILCNFLVQTLQCFLKQFANKKLKKTSSKVAQKNSNPLFFLTALTAQTAQTEEFIFQDVAYRPTVYYRTGIWPIKYTELIKKNVLQLLEKSHQFVNLLRKGNAYWPKFLRWSGNVYNMRWHTVQLFTFFMACCAWASAHSI